ncbi:MAG: acetylserotonin O-methyltransferase [Nitratireductor sp.]|nr:acetylserotonin O-methyltransferase [Nitratireductor sp.]
MDERWRRWRNGMVASPRFQEFANRVWPLSIIARRRAASLFSTVSGFIHSQILFACLETGVIDFLKGGPRTEREIARHTNIRESQLSRLLDGALALKLVSRDRQGRWWLDDAGAVVAGNPGIAAMIRHHAMLYRDLDDPVKLLREPDLPTQTQAFWSYVRSPDVDAATAAQYSALMSASQDMLIAEVLAAVAFKDGETLLDIGGGEGAFLRAAGEKHGGLQLWLFDLPSVPAPKGRIRKFAGDFFETPLPQGADTITLLRVVCDHEDSHVLRLLNNVRQALPPGGRLIIGEPMAGAGEEASLASAYFSFYFLAMRSGRCRTPQQICALLKEAGFSKNRIIETRAPLAATIIDARP